MKFYIQKNISEKDVNELVEIFEKKNISYELFYHIPFDDSYPEIDKNQSAFVYAASFVTDKVIEDHKIFSGVFAHTKDINLENFLRNHLELMWNKPLYMGEFKSFILNEEEIFIRPLIDSKWLAGTVLTKQEYEDWKIKLQNIDFDFSESIFVSKVYQPKDEYRLFFVNQKYSTGSQYKKNYEAYKKVLNNQEVVSLAENFVKENKEILPQSFVVDVGFDDNHKGIIEVNGINNAGFYEIDKSKLIADLLKT